MALMKELVSSSIMFVISTVFPNSAKLTLPSPCYFLRWRKHISNSTAISNLAHTECPPTIHVPANSHSLHMKIYSSYYNVKYFKGTRFFVHVSI